MELEILYRDEHLIAINKPHNLLVHRSPIASDTSQFAVQVLRDQIGQWVFPAHRLDRKTAGILLFGLSKELNVALQNEFYFKRVEKKYQAIVRGFTADFDTINYDLTRESGTTQSAITHYKTISKVELNFPSGKNLTSRYSMVEANPETGRFHQLRKHFAHIFHPIIGDRPHGCNKQNKIFLEKFQHNDMLLHASFLLFKHPISNQIIELKADFQPSFKRMIDLMGFSL